MTAGGWILLVSAPSRASYSLTSLHECQLVSKLSQRQKVSDCGWRDEMFLNIYSTIRLFDCIVHTESSALYVFSHCTIPLLIFDNMTLI